MVSLYLLMLFFLTTETAIVTSLHAFNADVAFTKLQERVQKDPNALVVSFRDEAEALLQHQSSSLPVVEVQLLHGRYMGHVRDIYLKKFLSTARRQSSRAEMEALSKSIVAECRLTMEASTPGSRLAEWSFEGYLSELELDLRQCCDDVQDESTVTLSASAVSKQKWSRRMRWLGAQFGLLAINILQSEWQRRAIRRAAERRLAEVPEFPLL